jgi:phage repressor protein C with HTH and peptisase S24 domain
MNVSEAPGSHPQGSLSQRVIWLRERAGLSQSALARRLGVSPQSIQQLESAHVRRPRYLLALSRLFEVSPGWLEDGSGNAGEVPALESKRELPPANTLPGALYVPTPANQPADVEVWGVAAGGDGGDFTFNGTVIDYVRRPPGLSDARTVFAIYVVGDSMAPRYEHGDLIFVHKGRPARLGDDVVVELRGEAGAPGACYVKRLLRRSASKITLRQFNPPRDDLEFKTAEIKQIYRVLSTAELLGV